MTHFFGFDGSTFSIGSRVELHPAMDLWMRGARYGTVIGSRSPKSGLCRMTVQLDRLPNKKLVCDETDLRAV